MHEIYSEVGAQFVIAVFDDWDALQAVLKDASAYEFDRFGTLLHARKDDPPPAVRSGLLKEITELQFVESKQRICCTRGEVAEQLTAKLAHGARSLADALHSWLGTDQAWQLQSHIEKGHLVLWIQLPSEEFGAVCGRLLQASPHMIGLCNLRLHTAKGR
jgi:hypothetical protein